MTTEMTKDEIYEKELEEQLRFSFSYITSPPLRLEFQEKDPLILHPSSLDFFQQLIQILEFVRRIPTEEKEALIERLHRHPEFDTPKHYAFFDTVDQALKIPNPAMESQL